MLFNEDGIMTLATCMFVLVTAVSHSPATDITSSPCEIWLKYKGCAAAEHHIQTQHMIVLIVLAADDR